jgi:penicillin-binding protein 2
MEYTKRFQLLTTYSQILVVLLGLTMVARLIDLTVVNGAYYARMSDQNRLRKTTIYASRGTIFDRTGRVLAESNPQSHLGMHSTRIYRVGEAFGHVLGYLAQPSHDEILLDTCTQQPLLPQAWVGKAGTEKHYECQLRGVNGYILKEVSSTEEFQKIVETVPALAGADITLALDASLQEVAFEQIRDKRAAVVAMKPQTGEVLILVSSPSYNPQDFLDSTQKVKQYLTSQDKPLFNRALEGVYPAGSVFKMVVVAAALEEGQVRPETTVEDTGFVMAGDRRFGNWYYLEYGKTEGAVDLVKSLQRSNDIYYYKISEKLGATNIAKWAQRFGYGSPTRVSLPERSGTLPSPFWKEDVLKERWYLGDTYNFSIGQGYLEVTPLQVAQMTQILANRGRKCKPKLLKIVAGDGVLQDQKAECTSAIISSSTLQQIQKGMIAACEPGGTGWPFFNFSVNQRITDESGNVSEKKQPITVACKTGTAENHSKSEQPHAWFTAYAPAQSPEIVVTVVVEEGGQGSHVAAPIAKEILTKYFSQ